MKHLKSYDQLNEKAMGDCYPAGGRLIMNFFGDENHKLVHGMVNGQGSLEGMRYGHCWVESKDTVLDHSNGKKLEIPTRVYYALGGVDPKECKYYTPSEAAKWMSEEEHWGPWEMSGDPVKLNEDIPDEHDEIGKNEIKIKNKDMKNIKKFEDFEVVEEKKKKGLWANVHAKRKRGEKAAKPGDEDYPDEEAWKDAQKESKVTEVKNMPEATKVWDELVKTFSDNKNDSIEYLNKDKSYRGFAIQAIFRAMNF